METVLVLVVIVLVALQFLGWRSSQETRDAVKGSAYTLELRIAHLRKELVIQKILPKVKLDPAPASSNGLRWDAAARRAARAAVPMPEDPGAPPTPRAPVSAVSRAAGEEEEEEATHVLDLTMRPARSPASRAAPEPSA